MNAATTSAPAMPQPAYRPVRPARERSLSLRGLQQRLLVWGDEHPTPASASTPLLVLLHGWMDMAASFQFFVDAFAGERRIVALDWRGFGGTRGAAGTDCYWFPDYLGDLDAVLDAIAPHGHAVDLLGHSMGGNVAMLYAGVQPERVRRLVNLEGFGLPDTTPEEAPTRYARWLDDLKQPQRLRDSTDLEEVARRLRATHPQLTPERAAWLAPHWAEQDAASGRWRPRADAAHKRANAVLYRAEEALACWARITAPVLWVEGAQTDVAKYWGERYPRAEFERRLAVVAQVQRAVIDGAGHMLHLDRPQELARLVEGFLNAPSP